eukprot:GHVR01067141.1.p1 GENE.GHVR01067141.1~~GHVR01067141.1.p1  ORF type:complete len:121 (+),score=3.22 GHVR01067141.1:2274-2636(+)
MMLSRQKRSLMDLISMEGRSILISAKEITLVSQRLADISVGRKSLHLKGTDITDDLILDLQAILIEEERETMKKRPKSIITIDQIPHVTGIAEITMKSLFRDDDLFTRSKTNNMHYYIKT